MGKLDDPRSSETSPPDETVKLVFNLSQDEDVRGPWNRRSPISTMSPTREPEGGLPPPPINADDEGHNSETGQDRGGSELALPCLLPNPGAPS